MAQSKWAGKSISYSYSWYRYGQGNPAYQSYCRKCPYHQWRRKKNKAARVARRVNRR